MLKRILFVDDEPRVLEGLRDLLRKRRKEWDMVFALGGPQALEELERGAFDVVVSDLRMPKVDGVALLRAVKERFPATVRIILSGQASQEALIGALPVAHRFLSKPCDAEALSAAIERASRLKTLLLDENIRSLVGQVDRLPSAPRLFWEISEAAANPNVGLADIAKIVERDASMAVKVLQLVNSSYFGLLQRQTSVQGAVAYLGAELVKSLALSAHVFVTEADPVEGFSLDALQEHSVLTARIAKRFFSDRTRASEAFTAALIHDVGKIVLSMGARERFAEVMRCVRQTGRPSHEVEREAFGTTHAEVGAYLLDLWGLPLDIVEAVAHHHNPSLAEPTDTLVAVHVADALCHEGACSDSEPTERGRLDIAFLEGSAFADQLPRWRTLADEEMLARRREG